MIDPLENIQLDKHEVKEIDEFYHGLSIPTIFLIYAYYTNHLRDCLSFKNYLESTCKLFYLQGSSYPFNGLTS